MNRPAVAQSEALKPSGRDRPALEALQDVIQVFKHYPDSVWPCYDLTHQPFIAYKPDEWVLYFNPPHQVQSFSACPPGWTELGSDVQYHAGAYPGLNGQLAFDFAVDSASVIAVPYDGRLAEGYFALVVHEAFHQYQHWEFGEIPWGREERYPLLDRENTALAYLEVRLLMEALVAMLSNDKLKCRARAAEFLAVRKLRWQHAPLVAEFEQGEELEEGTARYVEDRGVALRDRLRRRSAARGAAITGRLADLDSSVAALILPDFRDRIQGSSVSPRDMPRNRVYPVGAAQACLLSYFGVNWTAAAESAGPVFTYARLMAARLGADSARSESVAAQVKTTYGYQRVLNATDANIRRYRDEYDQHLRAFDAQPGYRIQVALSSNKLLRSRSTRGVRWVMDDGAWELCPLYLTYVLESDALSLHVHNTGVLEGNDWTARRKTAAFLAPKIQSVTLNGAPFPVRSDSTCRFDSLRVVGTGFDINCLRPGALTVSDRRLDIDVSK
jgi:hypothetical protein